MREVGRVGRFQILSEQDPPRDYVAEARARLEDRANREAAERRPTARELNTRQAEKRDAEHAMMPTAYDRLLGDDPYEDDLE
jgi:hypothetical protein